MSDTVSLDDWKRIVARARDEALDGDAKAREFLARHLVANASLRQSLPADQWLMATLSLPSTIDELTDGQVMARLTEGQPDDEPET